MTVLAAEAGAGEAAAAGSSTAARSASSSSGGSAAPRAPMGRRTTYQGPGRRQTERGSTVETGGGGSRVTINPGRERGPAGSRGAPGKAGGKGTGGRSGPPGAGGRAGPAGAKGPPGGRAKDRAAPPKAQPGTKDQAKNLQKRYNSATRRSTGISPLGNRDYQAIIAVEFVLAELLVAATPFATRKDRQGLSPYAPADMVKLLALGLVYLILMMIAAMAQGAGRVCAYLGALVLLTVGMGEAANLVDIIEALAGGKPHTITLTGTQAPAVKDPAPIPALGQDQPNKNHKGAGAPLGGG